MSKYFNPRLLNAVIAGTGMRNPVRPHVILGSEDGEFVRGDLMDANAIQEFVGQKIDELVNGAPEALDTLKELSNALNDDSNFATTVLNAIREASKQADWNQTDDTAVDYIKNKPDVALKSDIYTTVIDANSHDYVEIGGIKWATMNVGANSITDTGLYFQWGDTQGYAADRVGNGAGQKYFGLADYKYGDGTDSPSDAGMTKYNSTDGKTVLDAEDDAAVANWGGSWRMPTTAEFQALGAAVNTEWVSDYQGSGVAGLVCTDKTDSSKTLFFPACGSCDGGSVSYVGSNGYYWSSSLDSSFVRSACRLSFGSFYVGWQDYYNRYRGFTVRGILAEEVVPKFTTPSDIPAQVQSDWNQSDSTAIDYIKNKPTIPSLSGYATESWVGQQGYLTSHQDISGKEDKTVIEAASGATLTAQVGKYYTLSNVGTLAITLPTCTGTKTQSVVFYISTNTTPAVTFTSTHNIYYADGFEIESGSTYEVNALWNGTAWVITSIEIIIPT